MKDIAIVGAGGLGREAVCVIKAINSISPTWNFIGFYDDGLDIGASNEYGSVLGSVDDLNNIQESLAIIIAIATPKYLRLISDKLISPFLTFPNIVAPDCFFFDKNNFLIGKGNFIGFRCVFSCHVAIGDFNIFSCGCNIGHDVTMGCYNAVTNGVMLSGHVCLKDRNLMGAGSVILPGVTLNEGIVLGANSVLTRSPEIQGTYAGCPAVFKH